MMSLHDVSEWPTTMSYLTPPFPPFLGIIYQLQTMDVQARSVDPSYRKTCQEKCKTYKASLKSVKVYNWDV
jgi:hypothetical protein